MKSENLIQLLKARGFIHQVLNSFEGKTDYIHNFGAPGTLLRHNIKQQWWKTMVISQSNVFPIESSPLQFGNVKPTQDLSINSSEKNNLSQIQRTSLTSNCIERYPEILTLANGRLPFSIASVGDCFNGETEDSCEDKSSTQRFFTKSRISTQMLLQNYVSPSGTSRVFDYWLQRRLSWWKKFSKNPSKFQVSSSSAAGTTEGGDRGAESSSTCQSRGQSMSIVYDFPWGAESLEVVENLGDRDLRRLQESTGTNCKAKKTGAKSFLPHCIQCSTSVNLAMATFLVDSFHERKSLAKSKATTQLTPVLQLHPHLTPFHVALVITENQVSISKELQHVSKQLEQDLLQADVSVFNASEHVGSLNAHFKRNDHLGIPYTLVLKEKTLTDGVLYSRDRDTEIKKPVHVSKAVEEISRNVKAFLE